MVPRHGGIKNRVGEVIEDKVPLQMTNIQTKTKQQDIKHQIINNKKKQQAMEEPKYSGSEQKGKNDKTYNFRNTSTRAKLETKNREKEDNIYSELPQDKNSDNVCPL